MDLISGLTMLFPVLFLPGIMFRGKGIEKTGHALKKSVPFRDRSGFLIFSLQPSDKNIFRPVENG